MDNDQLCPICNYVLIDLAEYDARDNIAGTSAVSPARGPNDIGFFTGLYKYALASMKQKRLTVVLNQYPASLYCAQCGYLLKRT